MVIIKNESFINCSPQTLFDYVTQPWHWHDWHPSSVSATSDKTKLLLGDEFKETIKVQPLSPLPFTMIRHNQYKVTAYEYAKTWEVKGTMDDGWLIIHYDFEPQNEGVLFKRTLSFGISGFKKLFLPYLLKGRMETLSLIAIQNLKKKMENFGM